MWKLSSSKAIWLQFNLKRQQNKTERRQHKSLYKSNTNSFETKNEKSFIKTTAYSVTKQFYEACSIGWPLFLNFSSENDSQGENFETS